jgi:CubicO group peptidase (beta-lactamase class C family)
MPTELQDDLQQLLDGLVASGDERGAQVVVFQNGVEIANVSAGTTGGDAPRAVDANTLFPIFSTGKGFMCTAVHLLAERGQVDYDKPMTRYWPEFGANGKEGVTVRHALAHQAGIPYVPDDLTQEQMEDWDEMCRLVANLTPAWPPGARQFYHAHTLSWILGELVHRVDGRGFQAFVDAEINRPLGVEFFAGLPAALNTRVATIERADGFGEGMSPPPRQNPAFTVPIHFWINKPRNRALCSAGVNGISNARTIARHYASLLSGGVDGIELLPPSRVRIMTQLQTPSGGWPEGENARKGLGYQLGHCVSEYGGDDQSFGHNGHGGSVGFASPRNRLAVGITRNRFSSKNLGYVVWEKLQKRLALK